MRKQAKLIVPDVSDCPHHVAQQGVKRRYESVAQPGTRLGRKGLVSLFLLG